MAAQRAIDLTPRASAAGIRGAECKSCRGLMVSGLACSRCSHRPTMQVYAETALNFHPCAYDAYGMTIVEAASQGAPSVVAAGGAVGATALLRADREEAFVLDFSVPTERLAKQVLSSLGLEAGLGWGWCQDCRPLGSRLRVASDFQVVPAGCTLQQVTACMVRAARKLAHNLRSGRLNMPTGVQQPCQRAPAATCHRGDDGIPMLSCR